MLKRIYEEQDVRYILQCLKCRSLVFVPIGEEHECDHNWCPSCAGLERRQYKWPFFTIEEMRTEPHLKATLEWLKFTIME